MSNKTSDNNVASEEEKLMKSLEYELDKIIEKSSKVETATEIVYLRQPITLMFLKLLKELEQKDKRIQELEEESRKKSIELICYQEELEKRIAKQVVIDELQKLKNMFKATTQDILQEYTVEEIIIRSNVLQELLEGGENEKSY